MIELTKYTISTGHITGYLKVGTEQEVTGNVFMLPEGQALIDGEWEAETHYILNDEGLPRPTTGLPLSHELASDTDWSLPNVPEGTKVLIDGEEAGTVDATGLVLTFALAGVWRVGLRPPFPWLDASCEVTVT